MEAMGNNWNVLWMDLEERDENEARDPRESGGGIYRTPIQNDTISVFCLIYSCKSIFYWSNIFLEIHMES